ncbi:MgtC/SapB family protein [Acinetobacter indicus]|uniref:MgtC/SapB family protein n=1 Tax=Acinetobacter indicus TaxID=756892 RepID=UPI00148E84E7|nr:MgtC/SapB family protein [Acinetobacter indicus]
MEFLTAPSILSTSFQELMTMLAAALGCGLLIGLERERSKHNEANHHFAGVRTFAVCALLGAICFLLGPVLGIVGAVIIGGVGLFSLKNQVEDPGATTELAFIMTYFIGALCLWNIPLAAGLAVILTGLLMTKHLMHGIVSKWITEAELRDGLFLLALVLIALPLTPDTPLWGNVLNPYVILKLLILILSVQALAHIAKRLLSTNNALMLSSIASGFVSSTATIASLGMEVRSGRGDARINAGAALMSCVATLLQILIIIVGINLSWFKVFVVPSAVAIVILVAVGYWLLRKNTGSQQKAKEADSRMFSLKEAAIIVVTLTLIQAMVYGLDQALGSTGLIAGTFLASLFEIHAAAAAVITQGSPSNLTLFYALILGLGAHALAKCVNAFLIGGPRFALYFAPAQILHMAVLIGIAWWITFNY